MKHYWHVILEAIIDTGKILPLLFIVYYLIELLEYKYAIKFQNNKVLRSKASPVIGSLIGCIPQCGFSVVSTDLFSRRIISIGALIAVYIATSDEAIPIMMSNPKSIPWMLLLIVIKVVVAIIVGYLSVWLYKIIFKKRQNKQTEHNHEDVHHDENDHHEHEHEDEHIHKNDHQDEEIIAHSACCHHNVEKKTFDWLHPLQHCLKISLFILIINIVLNCVTHIWVGEERLMNFLEASKYLQPILAVLVGLIPNCASSVALTELFLVGGLKFGALLAGLCVNAGLGIVMLLRQNKNWKENLFIFAMLVIPSIVVGYVFLFV